MKVTLEKLNKRIKEINWKLWRKVGYWLVLAVLVLFAGAAAISTLNIPGNYKLLVVHSGSMEPAVKLGSIVVIKPVGEYRKGDIISFTGPDDPKYSVTHRIFEISGGGTIFVTKGDANDAPDARTVSKDQVLGKMIFTIPLLGYPIGFAKTWLGLILLVVVPATLIIFGEVRVIKNELLKHIQSRKSTKKKRERLAKILFLLISLSVLSLALGVTVARLSDVEISQGNTFQAGTW